MRPPDKFRTLCRQLAKSGRRALALLLFCPTLAHGAAPANSTPIAALVSDGAFLVKKGATVIAAHNPDRRLMTASIFKIATAAAALRRLGPEFRFNTDFYQNEEGDLFIKGWGDPGLTSEEVAYIIGELRERGLKPVRRLLLDDSAFQLEREIGEGSRNPYDAGNAPLAVNFNTVNLTVAANRQVRSGEAQTPTLPLMAALGRDLPPGTQRISLPASLAMANRHAGELFIYLGEREAAELFAPERITIGRGEAPRGPEPLYRHRSRPPLSSNLAELLRYSNNFSANQIFLTLGAHKHGYPATWAKGKEAVAEYLHQELGIAAKELTLEEGSGLSRQNQATAGAMLTILEAFRPHAELLPERQGQSVKSGTLTGVYAYAGYFHNGAQRDPFVLILNQPRNTRDKLLTLLEQRYRQAP